MQVCLDYLAGAHYPDEILAGHQPGVGAGFLYSPFKNPLERIAPAMAKKGPAYCPLFRFHRKFNYDHNFPRREWESLAEYTRQVNAFALANPKHAVFYSPTCEHNLKRSEAAELMLMCSRYITAPNLQLVNTIYKGSPLPGIVDEVHGAKVKAPDSEFWFKSADGIGGNLIRKPDIYEPRWCDIDVPEWMNAGDRCAAIFGWNFLFNLKFGAKDKTPVEKRKLKPSPEYIKAHTRLLFPIGGKQDTKNGLTWKAIADDHEPEDWKDNKALAIVPERHSLVGLYAANGKEIATAKLYGSYKAGGYRFYFREWAYQLAAKARKISGSEFCTLRAGRANYGTFNPAFRGKPK